MEIESRLRDIENNKNLLENRLNKQLRVISVQRAELDRQELEVMATMLKDDQENKILIGSFLEASCKEAFEMDDITHVESTTVDQLETDSDESDDGYKLIAKPEDRNDNLYANDSLHLLDST